MAKQNFVEVMPVDDIFIMSIGMIESVGDGLLRIYLCAEEGGRSVLKARLLMQLESAIAMNTVAASAFATEYRKSHPLRAV